MKRKLPVARTGLVAAILIVIVTWSVGVGARVAMAGWTHIEVVKLPAIPRRMYPGVTRNISWFVGVDQRGDVLAALTPRRFFPPVRYEIARYNLRLRQWLRGEFPYYWTQSRVSEIASGNRYWVIREEYDYNVGSLLKSVSSEGTAVWFGFHVPINRLYDAAQSFGVESPNGASRELLGPGRRGWLYVDAFSADASGNAWVAGWHNARFGRGRRVWCSANEFGRCDFPGRPVLARVTAKGSIHILRVPTAGEITAVANGPAGMVWMLEGARLCSKRVGNTRCANPRLISYNQKTGAFHSYSVPTPFNLIDEPLTVGPDGRVWIGRMGGSSAGESFLEFVNGHFKNLEFRAAIRGGEGDAAPLPVPDYRGDVWTCMENDPPVDIDANSGQTATLDTPPGTLLADAKYRLYSVSSGPTVNWSCGT